MRAPVRLALLLAIVAACNGQTDDAGPTSGPISAADFPARYAQTYCQTIAPCCEGAGVAYDEAGCIAEQAFAPEKYVPLTNGQLATFDPEAAGRCLDAMRAAGCRVQHDVATPGCGGVFVGVVPLGGECFQDLQCAPHEGVHPQCLGQKSDGGLGKCVVFREAVGLGQGCGQDDFATCAPDLLCADPYAPTSRCVEPPSLGEPCAEIRGSFVCGADARCAPETKTCVARARDGEPCQTTFDDCAADLFCAAGTCAPKLADGNPCENAEGCLGGYCRRGKCGARYVYECSAEDDASPAPR